MFKETANGKSQERPAAPARARPGSYRLPFAVCCLIEHCRLLFAVSSSKEDLPGTSSREAPAALAPHTGYYPLTEGQVCRERENQDFEPANQFAAFHITLTPWWTYSNIPQNRQKANPAAAMEIWAK
jgi:hypothetical protein